MQPEIGQPGTIPLISETPQRVPRLWGGWATIGLGVAIMAIYIIVQSIVAVAFVIGELVNNPEIIDPQALLKLASNGDLISAATLASAIVGIGFIVLFIKIRRGAGLRDYLEIKRISKKSVFILLGVFIGLVVLSSGFDLVWQAPQNTMFMIDAYNTATWPVLLWIAVIIFAPLFEESFFRGFVFVGLRNSRIGAAGTIAVTSLSWTLLHIQYDIYGMVTILILGIAFGIVRYKVRSLWSTIFLHALWNTIAMVGTVLYINGIIQ